MTDDLQTQLAAALESVGVGAMDTRCVFCARPRTIHNGYLEEECDCDDPQFAATPLQLPALTEKAEGWLSSDPKRAVLWAKSVEKYMAGNRMALIDSMRCVVIDMLFFMLNETARAECALTATQKVRE